MTDKQAMLELADRIRSGELELVFCHPTGKFPALSASQEQRDMVEAVLRSAQQAEAKETLGGMIADIYKGLDTEDCLYVDREWMKFRCTPSPALGAGARDEVAAHFLAADAGSDTAWARPRLHEWKVQEHCGDCTNTPITCNRCVAEDAYKHADALLSAIRAPLTVGAGAREATGALLHLAEELRVSAASGLDMAKVMNRTAYSLQSIAALADTVTETGGRGEGGLDRKGAGAAAEAIFDYTDNNLTMMDACDMDTSKALELFEAAKRLRDMLAPSVSSTDGNTP